MAIIDTLTGSRSITFTAIFAAMIAVLDSIPMIPGFYGGIWDSWAFMLSPLIGILLGPIAGAISVGLGGVVGHLVYFRTPIELLFMLGAPIGAGMAGLVFQERWRSVLAIYSLFLLGYFITPVTWSLSLLGVWDVLVGFTLILAVTLVSSRLNKMGYEILSSTNMKLILGTVIGLEADILVRIFILIPGQMWWLYYAMPLEILQGLWLVAGIITPIKVVVAAIATVAIGKVLLYHFREQYPDSENQLSMD
ncbi:MAG: hypothetical protein ACTSWQ_02745 [Candidatus Thorarchaeota archaeon]